MITYYCLLGTNKADNEDNINHDFTLTDVSPYMCQIGSNYDVMLLITVYSFVHL